MTTRISLLVLLLASGCNAVGDMADNAGSFMPTIGERCEHWQCFTESGRAQSEMIKAQRMQEYEPAAGSPQ